MIYDIDETSFIVFALSEDELLYLSSGKSGILYCDEAEIKSMSLKDLKEKELKVRLRGFNGEEGFSVEPMDEEIMKKADIRRVIEITMSDHKGTLRYTIEFGEGSYEEN